MANKQILTNAEIEKDIISALKNPPKESKKSYKRWTIPCIIIAIVLFVIEFIYPIFILWLLLALFVFSIVAGIFHYFRLKKRIGKVMISDYDITAEVVNSTAEEQYRMVVSGSSIKGLHRVQINNYIIHFDSGKVWRVPKELYRWNERLRMYDREIFNSTHRGDTMIVVKEKISDKIVVAYNTEFFEYKN